MLHERVDMVKTAGATLAKRKLLQWMRERLTSHAGKVVLPAREKKALDAAYTKASALVLATVAKRYPLADMKVLERYEAGSKQSDIKLQFPNGVVTQFTFDDGAGPYTPSISYSGRMFLADASTAAAIDRWEAARGEYTEERKKRLAAYTALIAGADYIEDIIALWPEAKDILPAGSPPIPLGPEQIALVKADMKERKAA